MNKNEENFESLSNPKILKLFISYPRQIFIVSGKRFFFSGTRTPLSLILKNLGSLPT